jgi:hypothetical protein
MNIEAFLQEHPDLRPFIVRTEGENSKWGRVVCQWKERKEDGRVITHIYTSLINLEPGKHFGEIYLDCSKKKIYTKFIVHLAIRPFLIVLKTLYHAAIPLSLIHIVASTIFKGIKKEEAKTIALDCLKESAKSLADIFRTPAYGVAMIAVSVAALIIGPFAPRTLYTFREMIGRLVQSLHRSNKPVKDLFICFQYLQKLQKINSYPGYDFEDDTINAPRASEHAIGLNEWAKAQVKYRRDHYAIFNNSFGKLDPEARYVSASYGDVEKAQAQAT